MSTDLNKLFDSMNRGDVFAITDQLFPRSAVSSAIPSSEVAGTGRHSLRETAPEVLGGSTADCGPATVGVSSERATAERYLGKPIVTVHVFPPIPCRRNDWCAYPGGEEENGNYGWGRTEHDAIADLIEILRDDERLPIRWAP